MIIIAILLILVAVAGGAFIFTGTSGQTANIDLTVLGYTVSMPPLSLAVSGAVVVLVLWLGWAILRAGIKRRARLRREEKDQARLATEEQAARERQWALEREQTDQHHRAEQEAAAQRLADQKAATETARQRAEVAERGTSDDA